MLKSRKDKLTVGILSRLKQKGPPRNEIPDQSLMGGPEEEQDPLNPPQQPGPQEPNDGLDQAQDETMNDIATVPPGQGLQKPPRRKQPAGGPAY